MKTNEQLQKDVQASIKWEPLLNIAEIGVTAIDGVVTLTGNVDSYAKKLEAELATKKVNGVKAIVEKIEVHFDENLSNKSDAEIATALLNGLQGIWDVPTEKVMVQVAKGWVTLEGELQWNHQREAATRTANNQTGVTGVTNNILIRNGVEDKVEMKNIVSALQRNWSINDGNVEVAISASEVILKGSVHSFYAKEEAERIAWNAPGVFSVSNELVIKNDW